MNNGNFEKFLEILDDDLKKIFEYQKEYIVCKKGCSLCCRRGDYPLSEIEFEYLKAGFEKLNEETKEKINNNIEELKKGNRDSYICPFLMEDSCSIYSHRPIICRTFGVLTEDSKGNPSFPFCTTLGLNFSKIYDSENKRLSSKLALSGNFTILPKIFRLSNNIIMKLPLAKELNIEFGQAKKMIDFLLPETGDTKSSNE